MTLRFHIETAQREIRLAILREDDAIWPHPGIGDEASSFDPEDVLSYLVDSWPSLLMTETFPIPFPPNQMPRSLTGLAGAAEDRWNALGQADASLVQDEQERLDAFLYHHDLSQMKFGADLEPFYLLKNGPRMRVECFGQQYKGISFSTFVDELERLGNLAAEILGGSHSLSAKWQQRNQLDPLAAVSLISGIPLSQCHHGRTSLTVLTTAIARRPLKEIANDNPNPIFAAARGAGGLGVASLGEITTLIQSMTGTGGTVLHKLHRQIHGKIQTVRNPTDQGILAANLLRDEFPCPPNMPFDLDDITTKLEIQVQRKNLSDTRLDGIAIASGQHGPAIVLNQRTKRRGANELDLEHSLRFTLAHELGHLVMDDRQEWPVLVDITDGQRIPREVETRANAFATELLLPHAIALEYWHTAGEPQDWNGLSSLCSTLTERFGLPYTAASRQLEHSVPSELRQPVREIFSRNLSNPAS